MEQCSGFRDIVNSFNCTNKLLANENVKFNWRSDLTGPESYSSVKFIIVSLFFFNLLWF